MTGLLHRRAHPSARRPPGVAPLPRQSVPAAAAVVIAPGRPVVYGCFSCPWCYLASQHSDQLDGLPVGPQWRMVVPDPHLPVTGLRLDAAGRAGRQTELAAVAGALLPGEQLPREAPAFLPNTGPAVAGYAEACGAGVGDLVRRVLFAAYWQHGADIGNPDILRGLLAQPILSGHSTSWPLRESGYAVTLAGGPITNQAYRTMRDWQTGWHQTAGDIVPAMVGGDNIVSGPDVLDALRALVLARPGATAAPSAGPGTPAWVTARSIDHRFLSTRGPVFEGTGALSAYGTVRPSVSEPGKPDGEVAT